MGLWALGFGLWAALSMSEKGSTALKHCPALVKWVEVEKQALPMSYAYALPQPLWVGGGGVWPRGAGTNSPWDRGL